MDDFRLSSYMGGRYVIKPCAVGYGIYDEPYWFQGERIEGLYRTYKTLEECLELVHASGVDYRIEEND